MACPLPWPCRIPRIRSDREKFLALSGTSLVVVFFLTSVGATMFYALGLSMLLIGAHAALRVPGAWRDGWGQVGRGERGLDTRARVVWDRAVAWHDLLTQGTAAVATPRCHQCALQVLCSSSLPTPPPAADDLFLDEAPEQQSGGFLSLLTGGSKPMAAVVANAV